MSLFLSQLQLCPLFLCKGNILGQQAAGYQVVTRCWCCPSSPSCSALPVLFFHTHPGCISFSPSPFLFLPLPFPVLCLTTLVCDDSKFVSFKWNREYKLCFTVYLNGMNGIPTCAQTTITVDPDAVVSIVTGPKSG